MAYFWIVLSLLFSWGAIDLRVGTPAHPGPGFMPLLIGIFMGAVSIVMLLRDPEKASELPQGKKETLFPLKRMRKHFLLLGSLIAYGLMAPRLGFMVSTAIFMLFLFKAIEPQKWTTAILATTVTVVLSYYLFIVGLGCQFPTMQWK